MKLSSGHDRLAIAVSFVLLGAFSLAAATTGYHLLEKYKFGPAKGSTREYFDYITVDSSARRVYVSHGTEIKVLNADSGALIGNITGLKQDHGVAVAHDFNRGFISDGGQGKVIIFDLKTLKLTGEAKADNDADCVVYDPSPKRAFAMNGEPHSATVIDAKSGAVVKTIELGGGPEFAVADGKGTVYVNMEDKNEVVAIDSTRSPSSRAGRSDRPEGQPRSRWTSSTSDCSAPAATPSFSW
jgi:DNA-binding beta-propeller fold protein YncE